MRTAILYIFLLFACHSVQADRLWRDSETADSIVRLLSARAVDPVEGIWRVAGMRSIIAVIGGAPDTYNIIAIDVDAPAVMPGTLIGTMRATAARGKYDAKIFTKVNPDGSMRKKADFIVTVDVAQNRFTLHHYYKGLAVRMWRSIPYLFGATLRNRDTRPEDVDGCLRLWPEPDVSPQVTIL